MEVGDMLLIYLYKSVNVMDDKNCFELLRASHGAVTGMGVVSLLTRCLCLQRKTSHSGTECGGCDEELNEIHVRNTALLNTTTPMASDRGGWGQGRVGGGGGIVGGPHPTPIFPPSTTNTCSSATTTASPSVVAVSKPNSTTTVTTAIVNLGTPSPAGGDSETAPPSQGVLRISSL